MMKMNTVWRREDIPYDAMGDYSAFRFEGEEDEECGDTDRTDDVSDISQEKADTGQTVL